MRISRPCYDKPYRCPGWSGGGDLFAKRVRCQNKTGSMVNMYDKRLWQWRFNRHPECGVVVLPYVVRWLDWRWWKYVLMRAVRRCQS